jgi:zinc transport system ATP-binding protein
MTDAGVELLHCRDLCIGREGEALLPPFDLSVRAGELWAVIGRNGSGKTTLMRTLLGLLPPVSGSVTPVRPGLKFAYLSQRAGLDEFYPLLGEDVVAMGCERGWSFARSHGAGLEQRVERALSEMGTREFGRQRYGSLSDGQKQRVMFTRLAVSDGELMLADEPTSAMDLVAEREAFRLLDRIRHERRLGIVIASHFQGLAQRLADRVILLDRDTPAVVIGTPGEVFAHAAFRDNYGGIDDAPAHG